MMLIEYLKENQVPFEMKEDNLTVGGSLYLSNTGITTLPDNLTVGGVLDLRNTGISSLPDNLTVGGSLYLSNTGISSLPDNLTIGGWLDLRNTGISSLPDNLTVGGVLDLRNTGITTLPDNLTVGGWLYLSGTSIKNTDIDKVNSSAIGVKSIIEKRFNAKGFTLADGVLAKIISKKGDVTKVVIVGQTRESYLVSDGNGNYAHGETIKQARKDLVYKITTDFDGELPDKATGKKWIGIYRAVTGACSLGVKHFVRRVGKSLDDEYTAEDIASLIKGQYGEDKFNKLLKKKG